MSDDRDPHAGQPVLHRGPAAGDARLAAILVHGRGASAEDLLTLADDRALDDVAYFAPQAAGGSWDPLSFLAPIARNEPGLTSALRLLTNILADLDRQGVPADRVALVGFSQGGCLSLELAARNPQRYAAIAGLSAGLIGPLGMSRNDQGSLDGTPVFLGCSDIDPHIPLERVHDSRDVLRQLGGVVDERIYPGMGHTVNQDEIDAVRRLLSHAG
jgi:predicted esterase